MATITVRLNEDEKRLYEEYARYKNVPLSTLLKQVFNEKIEDEIDLKAILAYEDRVSTNEIEYVTFEEIKERIGM